MDDPTDGKRERINVRRMVQLGGLEPPTSGSTIRRSNQLSYNCTYGLSANLLRALIRRSPRGALGCAPVLDFASDPTELQLHALAASRQRRTGLLWAHHSKSKALGGEIRRICRPAPGFRKGALSASLPP